MIFSPDRSPSSFLTSPRHPITPPSSLHPLVASPSPHHLYILSLLLHLLVTSSSSLHPPVTSSSPRYLFIPPSSPHLSITSTSPVAATFPRHLHIPSSSVHPTAPPSSPRRSCAPLVIPAPPSSFRRKPESIGRSPTQNVIRPAGMARPALRRRTTRAAGVECVGKAATERRAPQAQGPTRCARSLSLSKSRRASKRAVR